MRIFLTGVFSCFVGLTAYGQIYAPKSIDYEVISLHTPIEIPMILAGNFGEMRKDHFHTGLDIKTNNTEGYKLFSIESGVVSRIRVSAWGYGLAVYIDHPNGLTSVYGHMSRFSPAIDSLVHHYQVKNESWILDQAVVGDSLNVSRGSVIGYSGNSGSSSAPHLHFEIRETATEHAINPLLFRCYRKTIADLTPPDIKGIKVYAVTAKGYLIPGKSKFFSCTKSEKGWIINGGQPLDISNLMCPNSYVAVGIHSNDRLDGAGNVCGVYSSSFTRGTQSLHEQKMEYIDFDHNGYLNTHQDYWEFEDNNRDIHKQFANAVNPLSIYPLKGGLIEWNQLDQDFTYKAWDVHGNLQSITFRLKNTGDQMSENPLDKTSKYYFPDSVTLLLNEEFQVVIEEGSFYEPAEKIFKIDRNSIYLSPKYQFCENTIPVEKEFKFRLKLTDIPVGISTDKLGLGLLNQDGYLSFLGGFYLNGWMEGNASAFGQFVVVADTTLPKISPLDFTEGKLISKYRNLQLEITDNLSGISVYKAWINGTWVVMEYDRKKKRYVIPFNEWSKPLLRSGRNIIRIYAKDKRGNESEYACSVVW